MNWSLQQEFGPGAATPLETKIKYVKESWCLEFLILIMNTGVRWNTGARFERTYHTISRLLLVHSRQKQDLKQKKRFLMRPYSG